VPSWARVMVTADPTPVVFIHSSSLFNLEKVYSVQFLKYNLNYSDNWKRIRLYYSY